MTQCRLIGLTGGIATGKTTVSNIIGENYKVIDADKIAKDIVNKGMKGYNMVVESFGKEILLASGEIDRARLAKQIFNSDLEREKLNSILHPLIFDEIESEISDNKGQDYLFLDLPLLFESREELTGRGIVFYQVWLVYSNYDSQIERLMLRDGIDLDYAGKKIDSQMPLDIKVKKADKIIYNNEGLEDLRAYVDVLLSNLD